MTVILITRRGRKEYLNTNSSIYYNTFLSFVILTFLFVFVVTTTRAFNSTDLKCNMHIRGPLVTFLLSILLELTP